MKVTDKRHSNFSNISKLKYSKPLDLQSCSPSSDLKSLAEEKINVERPNKTNNYTKKLFVRVQPFCSKILRKFLLIFGREKQVVRNTNFLPEATGTLKKTAKDFIKFIRLLMMVLKTIHEFKWRSRRRGLEFVTPKQVSIINDVTNVNETEPMAIKLYFAKNKWIRHLILFFKKHFKKALDKFSKHFLMA